MSDADENICDVFVFQKYNQIGELINPLQLSLTRDLIEIINDGNDEVEFEEFVEIYHKVGIYMESDTFGMFERKMITELKLGRVTRNERRSGQKF